MTAGTPVAGTAPADPPVEAPGQPRRPESELRAIVAEGSARFGDDSDPVLVLTWLGERLGTHRIAVASSMADTLMPALAARALPGVDVLFVDTGYHFAETLGLRDAVAATHDIRLRTLLPSTTVAEQDAQRGPRLHERDPDSCCALRKAAPMDAALVGYDAWVTGLRRFDHPGREAAAVVEWDARRGLVKLNPLVAYTDEQVDACVERYGLMENPLRQLGYRSIGCAPCTRAVGPDEHPRDGRWPTSAKTECGLHL